jgi:hypothetical protein
VVAGTSAGVIDRGGTVSHLDLELIRLMHEERLARAEQARRSSGLPPELTHRPAVGSTVRGWLSRHTRRPPSQGWESL